jgi:hypothetical protein
LCKWLRGLGLALAVLAFLACALLSKETGLTLVAVLATHDLLRSPPPPSPAAAPTLPESSPRQRQRRQHWVLVAVRLLFLAALAAAYLLLRMQLMAPEQEQEQELDPDGGDDDGGGGTSKSLLSFDEKGRVRVNLKQGLFNLFNFNFNFNSMSLDQSGLIRKAENPFASLTPVLTCVTVNDQFIIIITGLIFFQLLFFFTRSSIDSLFSPFFINVADHTSFRDMIHGITDHHSPTDGSSCINEQQSALTSSCITDYQHSFIP